LLTGVGWFLGGGLACTVPMAAAAAAAPIAIGLLLAPDEPLTDALLGGGVVGLVLLALIPVALQIRGGQAARGQLDASVLSDIRDHVMLSDSAKRVLFRDRELDLLQATIEDDIEACAFNRALVLCDDMERMLGASPEAEQLRERVLVARNRQLAAEIQRESETVMALLESGRWEEADRAAQRLQRLYPDSPALHGLQGRIAAAKGRWKRDLEASFHAAAERGEIEMAMDLLRTLDRVLEPTEAEHIRDVARGVVDQHRDTVSTRFKLAVSDHHWVDALQIGREIIREFPNDTMAEEVRKMVPTLESRAMEQHP
jgi:tetratricopeptide (TPR) repeat protein